MSSTVGNRLITLSIRVPKDSQIAALLPSQAVAAAAVVSALPRRHGNSRSGRFLDGFARSRKKTVPVLGKSLKLLKIEGACFVSLQPRPKHNTNIMRFLCFEAIQFGRHQITIAL